MDRQVKGKGEDDFMDMIRERGDIQIDSIRPNGVAYPFRRWWKRVQHGDTPSRLPIREDSGFSMWYIKNRQSQSWKS